MLQNWMLTLWGPNKLRSSTHKEMMKQLILYKFELAVSGSQKMESWTNGES